MQSLGNKIKEARKMANLKQSDISTSLGIKNTTVSNWEKDISKPDLDTIEYLCGLFNVSASYFIDDMASKEILSSSEKDHIKNYRTLSENDKKAVDNLIDTLCNKPPFGYSERLKSFTNVDGARAYLKEHNELSPAFSDKELSDDDICEMATRRYNK